MKKQAGFTLIEWMIVVALLTLMMSLAAPSVRELLASQRLQGVHAQLVTDLQFARGEAVRRRQHLIFQTGGDETTACYVVYTDAFGAGGCDCLRPPGSACQGAFEEVRSVQIPLASSVAMAASSSVSSRAVFEKETGYSTPGDLSVDLSSSVRGQLRVTIGPTGRITSCSPDGSVTRVPTC
jgi:prepilin-type N-terminal cleavage/methylation domain-containing protein